MSHCRYITADTDLKCLSQILLEICQKKKNGMERDEQLAVAPGTVSTIGSI